MTSAAVAVGKDAAEGARRNDKRSHTILKIQEREKRQNQERSTKAAKLCKGSYMRASSAAAV